MDEELKEAVKNMAKEYDKENNLKKKHDKRRKEIRDEIKDFLESRGLSEFDDDDYRVKIIENQRKKIKDEEKLLEIIKDYELNAVKDAPDLKALENLIDEGEVPEEALSEIAECINIQEWSYITTKNKME